MLHLDDALESWTKFLSAKTEASLAKAELIRNQEASRLEPYSMDSCMDALEAMGDVSDEAYNKACEKFMMAEWRNVEFNLILTTTKTFRYLIPKRKKIKKLFKLVSKSFIKLIIQINDMALRKNNKKNIYQCKKMLLNKLNDVK